MAKCLVSEFLLIVVSKYVAPYRGSGFKEVHVNKASASQRSTVFTSTVIAHPAFCNEF